MDYRIADAYRKSFELIGEKGFFDLILSEKLVNSVGFRNCFAHDHMNLNDEVTIKNFKIILQTYCK